MSPDWPAPVGFVAALFALTTVGALLPLDVGRVRQDYVVLTISATFVLGVLGPPGLLLVWASVLVPLAVRRAGRWLVGTATAITVGFSAAHATHTVALGRSYPLDVSTGGDLAVAALVLTVAWVGTMSIRVALHRFGGSDRTDGFDAFDSPLVPYLLPTVTGLPILAAALALYRPSAPWSAFGMLMWCLPLYAACRFDLHRRHLAQQLRRDLAARQRLATLGEVTARMLHQSRHQAALMGWSIHRLRHLLADPAPFTAVTAATATQELDALAAAKQRIQDTFDRELLHEPAGPADPAATAVGLDAMVAAVCAELAGKADQAGVVVDRSGAATAVAVAGSVREILFNLVDNAVDAAASRVRVTARCACGELVVVVDDDGPGVAPSVADRLHEPFVTTKPEGTGTGMGLAIADALVAELGGRLHHEHGDGITRFVVALPLPSTD